MTTTLFALLASLTMPSAMTEHAIAACPRAPATNIRSRGRPAAEVSPYLNRASRFLEVAYPGLGLFHDEEPYVIDGGTPYRVRVHFDQDEESGYAALTLTYNSQHEAALRTGQERGGTGCTSLVELVFGRVDASGAITILARSPLDAESSAIDVRTLDLNVDRDGPAVNFLYFAYYGAPGWFGHVGWRAGVTLEQGRLTTQRLPASYLKLSDPNHRQEGAIAPAAYRPGVVTLMMMGWGTKEESTELQFEIPEKVPLSGMDIMRKVP